LARSGGWRRLFPCVDRRYKQFFESDRYFNRLIREYENVDETGKATANYRSVNDRQRTSVSKPAKLRAGYSSINDKKRV
jgi:hypothetical protein